MGTLVHIYWTDVTDSGSVNCDMTIYQPVAFLVSFWANLTRRPNTHPMLVGAENLAHRSSAQIIRIITP